MYKEFKNGSKVTIGFDDHETEVNLPPVGFVFNKLTKKLERRPILFKGTVVKNQKWKRTELPENYEKRSQLEKAKQESNPKFVDEELEAFRAQEWDRRINGVWMHIGNRSGKPPETVYLTGLAYFYFNWWKCDFGFPSFRFVYLEVFYLLEWGIENPNCTGLILSTLRRFGKTAILGVFLFEFVSRMKTSYSGLQAQTKLDAKNKFMLNVIGPWRKLPDFFSPIYDFNSTQSSELNFKTPVSRGKTAFLMEKEDDNSLESKIDFRDASETAYDGEKLHRYAMEEPGKTKEANVSKRWDVVRPCLTNGPKVIGFAFMPTTIEEADEGGDEFVELFEDSFPNIAHSSPNGKTKTGCISHFIQGFKGYLFDEYGRSVIEDPEEGEEVFDEWGDQILEGAKTILKRDRDTVKDSPTKLAGLIRKYPWTWAEAKMVDNDKCVFNAVKLNDRLSEVSVMESMKQNVTTMGNFVWLDKDLGKVTFDANINGRFKVAQLIKKEEERNKVLNIGVVDGVIQFAPSNDIKFIIGTDPIEHGKVTDAKRSSDAAAYVFRKFDREVDDPNTVDDQGRIKWQTHNFVVQYIHRPLDPEIYYEDMIKICTYFGCSVLIENQKAGIMTYFKLRGYERFIMYRPKDTFTTEGNSQDTLGVPASKPMIGQYTEKLQTFYSHHAHRIFFTELLMDSLKFDPSNTKVHDATVAAGYTLLAAENKVELPKQTHLGNIFQLYDNSGGESRAYD